MMETRRKKQPSPSWGFLVVVVTGLWGVCSLLKGVEGFTLTTTPPATTKTNVHRHASLPPVFSSAAATRLGARRRDDYYSDEDYYGDDDDDDFDDDDEYYERRRRRRRGGGGGGAEDNVDDLGGSQMGGRRRAGLDVPSAYGRRDGWRLPESVSKALLAGVFVLGIGLGVTVDSAINTNPRDLASRDAVDQAAPNSKMCASMGASAMAFDQRVFVSFNPFNVYVAQADVKPACVLRQSNVVSVLRDRKLINDNEVRSCKANMNTWAFVGDLEDQPQLSCVYQSADAQNEFLSNPKFGIGEDYLDDDRAKNVKSDMTEGQKELLRKQMSEQQTMSFPWE